MNRQRALLFATLTLAGCGQNAAVPIASSDDALYGLGSLAQAWPGGNVPVCFTNINAQQALQAKIPGILANSWSKAANLHFTGFGSCNGGNVISVSFAAGTNGSTDDIGYGARSVTLISDDTTPGLAHFQYEVIHEIGHAIGFEHEMKRPDNWVGGVAKQCGVGNGSTDVTQFSAAPGGVNLTPNYDPNSIMNYCDPNGNQQTTLSVGDILGASNPSGYGLSSCAFTNSSTACTLRPQLQYDSTYTVPSGCPAATGAWVLKQVGGGAIATAPEANTFVLGHQAEGGAAWGPAIGSSPSYQMCDAFNNCSAPFNITITDCHTRVDNFYVTYNQTLYVTQGDTGFETLEMTGPWVNNDAGINAQGALVSTNMPYSTFSFGPGYANSTACAITGCFAFMDMTVGASFSTPPGDYSATVKATDLATQVTRTTVTPIHVAACTPPPPTCAGYECGGFTGCGQRLDCGSCSGTNVCSGGHCCAPGTDWDGYGCNPPPCNCKPGYYCDASNTCVRVGHCKPGTCM